MRSTKPLLFAALAASLAFVAVPVDAQRWGGGGGRPVAPYPGGKPSTGGGGHWNGGGWHGGGGWGGRGGWSGRHGHWGHHYRYWPAWSVGIGVGFGWPYLWGWDYYPYGVPVAVVDGPVYVNPEPMPAYGESFRWYCPASGGYYPDVRECARSWLKVVPSDRGPTPPPVSRDGASQPAEPGAPASPSSPATPRSQLPSYAPEPTASTGVVRLAAPRLTSPIEVAARKAPATALAHAEAAR